MVKTLVGPQLRQLRRAYNQTQADMAREIGVSPAYVNLLENNQRSLSVKVLLSLTEAYGVDWRKLMADSEGTHLADLRAAVRDPIFADNQPDLQELRAALDHAPKLVELFLRLRQDHRNLLDTVRNVSSNEALSDIQITRPETEIYDFFRDRSNHFPDIELAADSARAAIGGAQDDIYANLKRHLLNAYGITVDVVPMDQMTDTLRVFDQDAGNVMLSEVLDQTNRTFQLSHVLAMVSCGALLDTLVVDAGLRSDIGQARLRVELANYFAAALLMPYDDVLHLAESSLYDIDQIGARFGVSFEQVAQRLTTLQRPGAQGVPFFFLRTDRAGNVSKRFNATAFTLAEQGGSCPIWNIHSAFAIPDVILPQFVELPDAGQFFTISRTTNRPVMNRFTQDRRLVVTLGCERAHLRRIGYAAPLNLDDPSTISKIGINCHICPRQACAQRAHEPLHVSLPLDANRRGTTRYES